MEPKIYRILHKILRLINLRLSSPMPNLILNLNAILPMTYAV